MSGVHPAVDRVHGPYRKATLSLQALDAQRLIEEHAEKIRQAARDPRLERRTRHWAITTDAAGTAGTAGTIISGGVAAFELVNRETGIAHALYVVGLGLDVSLLPVGFSASAGRPAYTLFRTSRPMKFSEFDDRSARLTSAGSVLAGLSYLTVWSGRRWFSQPLAYVRQVGFELNTPGLAVHFGRTKLVLGSGKRSGKEHTVPLVLDIEIPPRSRGPRPVSIQLPAMDRPLIDVPNELLFDFDAAVLRPEATGPLRELGFHLNNRLRLPVVIEGHTDHIGDHAYNMDLSHRRAGAVKRRLIELEVFGAEDFEIQPWGATQPVADNTHPDGSDNPEGRAKNRRIAVRASWGR